MRSTSKIIEGGQGEAARANDLEGRQRRAARQIRARYEPRIAAASWLRKIRLRSEMRSEIRREKARIEEEIAPREALYLGHVLAQGEREIQAKDFSSDQSKA